MKKINFILKITPVILAVASIYLFIQNINFKSRISQLEKIVQFKPSIERDSLIRLLEVKDIQESQYLSNQSILSDWIILYVSVLFGVVVLIQILNFEMRTKNVEQKYEEQEIANKNHFDEFYARFEDLESDVNAVMGQLYSMQGQFYTEKDNMAAFDMYIGAVEKYLKSLNIKDEGDKNYYYVKNNLELALAYLNKYHLKGDFKDDDKFYFNEKDKLDFQETFSFLLLNLFNNHDREMVIEIMKTFDAIGENFGLN